MIAHVILWYVILYDVIVYHTLLLHIIFHDLISYYVTLQYYAIMYYNMVYHISLCYGVFCHTELGHIVLSSIWYCIAVHCFAFATLISLCHVFVTLLYCFAVFYGTIDSFVLHHIISPCITCQIFCARVCVSLSLYIYMYTYIHTCDVYIYTCIYVYIWTCLCRHVEDFWDIYIYTYMWCYVCRSVYLASCHAHIMIRGIKTCRNISQYMAAGYTVLYQLISHWFCNAAFSYWIPQDYGISYCRIHHTISVVIALVRCVVLYCAVLHCTMCHFMVCWCLLHNVVLHYVFILLVYHSIIWFSSKKHVPYIFHHGSCGAMDFRALRNVWHEAEESWGMTIPHPLHWEF